MYMKLFLTVLILICSSHSLVTEDLSECETESQHDEEDNLLGHFECASINPLLSNCTCSNDYVDCSNRSFQTLPSDFSKLPLNISRLFFSNNLLTSLDKIVLNESAQIKVLLLDRNKIERISDQFFSIQLAGSMEHLRICRNSNLTDFNLIKANFKNLTYLSMSYLKEPLVIRDHLFDKEKFPNLNKLELNNAKLKFETLPFADLNNLQILRLDSNELDELPCHSFNSLVNLASLNLTNNLLSRQSHVSQNCLDHLSALKELHFQSNGLTEENLLWIELDKLVELEKLDLSGNKLTKLPYSSLANLKRLVELKITIYEKNFTPFNLSDILWPNLSSLDLSNSIITNIPSGSLRSVSNELSELNLKNCSIKYVDADAFNGLNNLRHLDLSFNNLKSLYEPSNLKVFNYDMLRGNINLANNKFECNKDIQWFVNFYNYTKFDQSLECHMINGTKIPVKNFITINYTPTVLPPKSNSFNLLAIILLILIVLLVGMVITYFIRRKQVKERQQQYRYRYFTRSQDDGFDTDNVPVYRDCTVSLQIKENEDATNFINSENMGDTVEQPEVIVK